MQFNFVQILEHTCNNLRLNVYTFLLINPRLSVSVFVHGYLRNHEKNLANFFKNFLKFLEIFNRRASGLLLNFLRYAKFNFMLLGMQVFPKLD